MEDPISTNSRLVTITVRMSRKDALQTAAVSFNEFYSKQRSDWSLLRKSLLAPKSHVLRLNGFLEGIPCSDPSEIQHMQAMLSKCKKLDFNCFEVDSDSKIEAIPAATSALNLRPYYMMDFASVLPAIVLDVQPDSNVLDACAAPGGKSLILAEKIAQGTGRLVCNEVSNARRQKLSRIISEYVPPDVRRRIQVCGELRLSLNFMIL